MKKNGSKETHAKTKKGFSLCETLIITLPNPARPHDQRVAQSCKDDLAEKRRRSLSAAFVL